MKEQRGTQSAELGSDVLEAKGTIPTLENDESH